MRRDHLVRVLRFAIGATLLSGIGVLEADDACGPPLCFSAGENVTWSWGARLRFDATDFRDDDNIGLQDGTNLRRARLSQRLAVGDRWTLGATWDFANDGIDGLRDARLRYRPREGVRLTAGHFKQPFGLERLTSVRDLGYMERSLASELTPNRALGGEIHFHEDHATAALGVFGKQPTQDSDSNFGAALRATFAPLNGGGRVLHLGAAAAHRNLNGEGEIRFRQRPGSRSTDIRLVDSGTLTGHGASYVGFEAAAARDNWSVQGEYIVTRVGRKGSNSRNVLFDAWYLDVGWVVTGETRPYDREDGTFGRVRPPGPGFQGGAVKLNLRLDSLDLNSGDVVGGSQRNLTAGATWYLTPWALATAEYVKVLQTHRGEFDGARPALIQGALQLVF